MRKVLTHEEVKKILEEQKGLFITPLVQKAELENYRRALQASMDVGSYPEYTVYRNYNRLLGKYERFADNAVVKSTDYFDNPIFVILDKNGVVKAHFRFRCYNSVPY